MNSKLYRFGIFTLKMILVWAIAMTLLGFFRSFEGAGNGVLEQKSLVFRVLFSIAIGIIAGILYSLSELFFDRPKYRRWPYGKLLLTKGVAYFFIVNLLLGIAVLFFVLKEDSRPIADMAAEIRDSKVFWVLLVYFILVATLISFVRQVEQKFGPGILWKMLKGKYRSPKQEARIFMFLDLKSSTALAENLGHITFSKLIQDCFFDLNELITQHKAEIYQYVGDEAVLTWKYPEGLSGLNCIQLFFAFTQKLESKRAQYMAKYDVLPEFKAGVHLGEVMVAEVGIIKKEIAYHGDVLNTAARIQGQCNSYQEKILVSQDMVNVMDASLPLSSTYLGDITLKGKQQKVGLYSLNTL